MALIFDVKRFAVNDGPGIRTTLFVKGCPLRCVWCHNPEGLETEPVRLFNEKKCIGCGSCIDACPHGLLQKDRKDVCDRCGRCAEVCPTLAMQIAGREWDMEELMKEVERERGVMEESGGGVTICGGEPMMHPDYLLDLLVELKHRGFHTAVDTTLFASEQTVERVSSYADMWLIDLKHMDCGKHLLYTGVQNDRILSNIEYLSRKNARFWIRIPLIDGVNADDENLEKSARFLAALPKAPEVVNLLPYHDIGKGKHLRLGSVYNPTGIIMREPSEELQNHAIEIFSRHGLNVRTGG